MKELNGLFNENNFKIEFIGVNFLNSINSTKIYYQPNFSNIAESKIDFTKKIVQHIYKNKLNQSINTMVDFYSGTLLDLSIKKQGQSMSTRFNIRCPHKLYNNSEIEKTVRELGFGDSWNFVSIVNKSMSEYKNSQFDSLHIIGFSIENEIITSIKYYFSLLSGKIIPDYSDFKKYHSEDEDYFYKIMSTLNISKKNVQNLKKFFYNMNQSQSYIAFIGIDFDLAGNSYYKIYYNIPDYYNSDFILNNIIGENIPINDNTISYFKSKMSKDRKVEYIAVAFTKEDILQYQIYLGGGDINYNEIHKK